MAEVVPISSAQHRYLLRIAADFSFGLARGGQTYDRRRLQLGELLTLAAVLGPGKTLADVPQALNRGISADPNIAKSGLRIGVIAFHLLGKRPDIRVTIMDDAGYVRSSIVSR